MTDWAIPDTFLPRRLNMFAKANSAFNAQGDNDERHRHIAPRHRLLADAR